MQRCQAFSLGGRFLFVLLEWRDYLIREVADHSIHILRFWASMNRLAKNITRLRTEMELSGRQLAAIVGIDHSYLSRIESGEQAPDKISWGVLQGLAKALKVSVGELTGDTGYRYLDRLLQRLSGEDREIFNAIVDLPPTHARRKAAMEILGLDRSQSRRKVRPVRAKSSTV